MPDCAYTVLLLSVLSPDFYRTLSFSWEMTGEDPLQSLYLAMKAIESSLHKEIEQGEHFVFDRPHGQHIIDIESYFRQP